MKKIAVLFILLLCICACTKPKEPTVEPQPLEPTVIKEKEYIFSDGWVAQDFRFEDQLVSCQLKNGTVIKFKGIEKQERYCNEDGCIIYNDITLNDKHITFLENMSVKVNNQYGRLYIYNLNDKLYLFAFDYAAQYGQYDCVVIDDKGNEVKSFESVYLTMNTEYCNMFLIDYLTNAGEISHSEIYTATDYNLEGKDF